MEEGSLECRCQLLSQGVPSVRSKLRAEGYPRAHLENGILHIANLYAGVVICWLAGEEGLEPE